MPLPFDHSHKKDFAFAWRNYLKDWGKDLKDYDNFCFKSFQHMTLPSDIELVSLDMISLASAKHIEYVEQMPISFNFYISGQTCSRITYSATRKETVNTEANKVLIGFTPYCRSEIMLMGQQHYRAFNIYISPQRLYSLLGGKIDIAPVEIQKNLEGTFNGPFMNVFNMSPQTRMIIDQIQNCPYQGDLKELFLEHKIIELILRQFYEIQCDSAHHNPSKLAPNDIDRVKEAKRLLLENIENPPNLVQLAQQVGINQTKLKQGFRQVFGTTAYALVRQERIRRARDLLNNGDLNISEIGYQLGFSDTSHFIREFTKYYGMTPGKYSKASVM